MTAALFVLNIQPGLEDRKEKKYEQQQKKGGEVKDNKKNVETLKILPEKQIKYKTGDEIETRRGK